MPITIKPTQLKYKDPTSGNYESVVAAADGIDVQINDSSIVDNNGVAKIPVAETDTFGVIKVGSGLRVNTANKLVINPPSENTVKAGTETLNPLTPYLQHTSTFYGLAKAAGADMASLASTTVGQYPDAQKIAIQKMLGIYEPPYTLVNDITLQAETHLDLTTDDDGNPYNFRNVFINVWYPGDTPTASIGYGRYKFVDADNHYVYAETGKYNTSTSNCDKYLFLKREQNISMLNFTNRDTTGNSLVWRIKYFGCGIFVNSDSSSLGNIKKITMESSDVEPAGARIRIYAQWAY